MHDLGCHLDGLDLGGQPIGNLDGLDLGASFCIQIKPILQSFSSRSSGGE